MLTRLLLILTLFATQFSLPSAVVRQGAEQAACAASSCCEVVVQKSCCSADADAVQRVCHKSGGPCRCMVKSDQPEKTPAVPPSAENRTIGPFLRAGPVTLTKLTEGAPRQFVPVARSPYAAPPNIQALLCRWRT